MDEDPRKRVAKKAGRTGQAKGRACPSISAASVAARDRSPAPAASVSLRATLCASLLLVACGPRNASGVDGQRFANASAPFSRTVGTSSGDRARAFDAPPRAQRGEQLTFRASMHGLEVAELQIAVGDADLLDGQRVHTARSVIKSTAALALVKHVREDLSSWFEPARGASLRCLSDETIGDKNELIDVRVTREAVKFAVVRGKARKQLEQPLDAGEPVFDLNSLLFMLRAWEADDGASTIVNVVRSHRVWRGVLRVVGYDPVRIELGAFPALRIDGEMRRLTREGVIEAKTSARKFSLWVSDDLNRVPLLLIGESSYGDVRLELVSYLKGTP